MGILFSYSLEVSLFLLLLYPVGRIVVRKCTDFQFNRLFLLLGLGLSALLPFIMTLFRNRGTGAESVSEINSITETIIGTLSGNIAHGEPSVITYLYPAVWMYILGVIMLTLREIFSYLHLFRIIRQSEKIEDGNYIICTLRDSQLSPFSWGRYIFINSVAGIRGKDGILLHEKSHLAHLHWIDLLLTDILCILTWYNPFSWMTRRLIKLNHEFQADNSVIESGISPYSYQRLLLEAAMNRSVLGIANCFGSDRRGFRKRILNIGSVRSSRKVLLYSLCAVPLLGVGIFLTSLSASSSFLEKFSDMPFLPSFTSSTADDDDREKELSEEETSVAEFEGGESALYSFLVENMRFPVEPEELQTRRNVYVHFDVTEEGHIENIHVKKPQGDPFEEEAFRVIQLTDGKWKPAIKNGKPVKTSMVLPFQFATK